MIEIVVYTTLTIAVILLIKDVFFPSEKNKNKKEKEEFMVKIFKDIESNNNDNIVEIIKPDDVFTVDKPFIVIDYIENNKQLAVIAPIYNFKEDSDCIIKPKKDLYELMKNEKVDTVIGKKTVFYDR
nr:MAG TPA: hypothetical protein [Caudoviricetes sp.]